MAKKAKNITEEPVYNIGAVTRLTGIPVTTLHAWERRYGFPRASRTPGGHRLFTDNDISRLKWVKSQIDSGLGTHSAILAVQKGNKTGAAVLLPASGESAPFNMATPLPALRQQLYSSLIDMDWNRSDQILGDMLAFSPPEELTLNVIGPVLNQIGEEWAAGRIMVATEHLVSNYLRQRLLLWMVSSPRPRSGKPVMLACAPGEWHDGSLLMLGVLLRRQGIPVAYLGQNVPFEDLAKFIRRDPPAALVWVAMQEETAKTLIEWPEWIKEGHWNILITYGGRAFVNQPDLQKTIPGIYLGDTIQAGLKNLTELLEID